MASRLPVPPRPQQRQCARPGRAKNVYVREDRILSLRVRHSGSGPAVLLLHGHPRTHATWHKVAALLAERFTVVCPDLHGYGESSKPPTTPDHPGHTPSGPWPVIASP
jgi:pimeloyl-ACP methyl ester carboxylesterase